MADTTFTDQETRIYSSWLNDVNAATYKGGSAVFEQFGAIPNSSTTAAKAANDAAWLAAVAYFAEQSTATLDGTAYGNAGRLIFGAGSFWFGAGFVLTRNFHLLGASAPDGNSFGATRLIFPDTSHGIILHNYQSSGTTGADGTVLEKLTIVPAAYAASGVTPAAGAYNGVWMRCRAKIRDCQISGWTNHGLHIVATSGGGGVLEGNANCWEVDSLRIQQNGSHGVYVEGADANAGVATRVDSSSNTGWGFYDRSFLGNTYVGCHTAANGTGSYKTSNSNARHIFLGCYVEGGQPSPSFNGEDTAPGAASSAIILGGILATETMAAGSTGAILNNAIGDLRVRDTPILPFKGVDFQSTTATATATTLDAYTETITHTPTDAGTITTTGTIAYTFRGTRIGNRVKFRATIAVSGGNNTFVADTTYITLPASLVPIVSDTALAVTNDVSQVGICYVDTAGKLFLPNWGPSNKTVIISGEYLVSSTA